MFYSVERVSPPVKKNATLLSKQHSKIPALSAPPHQSATARHLHPQFSQGHKPPMSSFQHLTGSRNSLEALSPSPGVHATASQASTSTYPSVPYWEPRRGPADADFTDTVTRILAAIEPHEEWDRGRMLVLQAIMRRRVNEWFSDPRTNGGLFVRDAATLLSRLSLARNVTSCERPSIKLVAAIMTRSEGRYIQEWLLWHLFVGFSHFLVYYEDPDDGTLDALRPFIDANLVSAFHAASVPGMAASLTLKSNQIHRQQNAFDHALLLLQKTACRYRGVGSPLSVPECTSTELQSYYSRAARGSLNVSVDFVNPFNRGLDLQGRPHVGHNQIGKHLWWLRNKPQSAPPPEVLSKRQGSVSAPVIPGLWVSPIDSDEYVVPADGKCLTDVVLGFQSSHAALGFPWKPFLPSEILEPHSSLVLRSHTRIDSCPKESMPKYIANVQYAEALNIHFPFLKEPYVLRDERGRHINMLRKNKNGNILHDWLSHDGRGLWLHHIAYRSLEAAVFKYVRALLDDLDGGALRSNAVKLQFIQSVGAPDAIVARETQAWTSGRQFLLTLLIGPERSADWRDLWAPLVGDAESDLFSIVNGIVDAVSLKKEWDRGWALVMHAVMQRRAREWFSSPHTHGGLFVTDASTARERVASARIARPCTASGTPAGITLVAAALVQNHGRYIQEWIAWHLCAGYSHFLVYYEDPSDGTLAALEPFIGASLVTPFLTATIPGMPAAHDGDPIKRQQAVFDHALLLLQKTACRYRGAGSPTAVLMCSADELKHFYGSGGKRKQPGLFVDPYQRQRRVAKTSLDSSELVGPEWISLQERLSTAKDSTDLLRQEQPARRFVPHWQAPHHVWLAVADPHDYVVTSDGSCMTDVLRSLAGTHAAIGLPAREFLPNSILDPNNALLTWNLTRLRRSHFGNESVLRGYMPRYITNVRFTVAANLDRPIVQSPFSFLDESGSIIHGRAKNGDSVVSHDFGSNAGRKAWVHRYAAYSLEDLVWKDFRRVVLDPRTTGNRSSVGGRVDFNIRDLSEFSLDADRDSAAWEYSKEFVLRVLLGVEAPASATGRST